MNVQLDLSMRTAGVLVGGSLRKYQEGYQCVLQILCDTCLIADDPLRKDNCHLYYDDLIVAPEAQLDGCLQLGPSQFMAHWL